MIKLIRNHRVEEEFDELTIEILNRVEKELGLLQIEDNIRVECVYYTKDQAVDFTITPDSPMVAEKIQEILNGAY